MDGSIFAAEVRSLALLVVFRSSATRVNRTARPSMMQVWSWFLTETAGPQALHCPASYKIQSFHRELQEKSLRAQQKYFSWNLIASAFVDFLESTQP